MSRLVVEFERRITTIQCNGDEAFTDPTDPPKLINGAATNTRPGDNKASSIGARPVELEGRHVIIFNHSSSHPHSDGTGALAVVAATAGCGAGARAAGGAAEAAAGTGLPRVAVGVPT